MKTIYTNSSSEYILSSYGTNDITYFYKYSDPYVTKYETPSKSETVQ